MLHEVVQRVPKKNVGEQCERYRKHYGAKPNRTTVLETYTSKLTFIITHER
jgi:hypothetical protein